MVGAINRYGNDASRPWREIEMARLLIDVMIYPRSCFQFTARDCVILYIRIVETSFLHVSQTDLLDNRL